MISVTFNYGAENSITRQFEAGTTVGQALNTVRGALGAPENVSIVVDAIVKDRNYVLQDMDDIVLETAPAQKA